MFVVIEKYRTPMQILLGVVGLSFVTFGVANFQGGPNNNYIVKIGEQTVTRSDLDEALHNTEASGGKADRNSVFQTLVSQAYLVEGARKMGVAVSDEQIKQMVVDSPQFHGADNKFDPQLFQQYLQQNRLTEQAFMQRERTRLLSVALFAAAGNSAVADVQAAALWKAQYAPRTVRTIGINPAAFTDKVKADDAALKKFYDSNKKNYALAQGIKFEYVRLSPKGLLDKQTVSEEEIKQALTQAQTANQGKRRIAHILIAAPASADEKSKQEAKAAAEKIAAEVKAAPNKFAELAKKHSQDSATADKGGDLGEFAQNGSLPGGKALEDAAFALKQGEVSGVVQSDFGYHIVYVPEVRGGGDEAAQREQVVQTLKEKKAQQAYAKVREELGQAAFADTKALRPSAEKFGLTLQKQEEWLTRANAAELKVPTSVVEALFSDDVFNKKHNSEPVSVDGETWLVRALEVRPESMQPFDAVKDKVREDYIRSESMRLALEEGKKVLADLQAGKKTDVVWTAALDVLPLQARMQLPPKAFDAFMAAVPKNGKPAYALVEGVEGPELLKVEGIKVAEDAQIKAMMAENTKQSQMDKLLESYLVSLRSQIKTEQGAERISDSE